MQIHKYIKHERWEECLKYHTKLTFIKQQLKTSLMQHCKSWTSFLLRWVWPFFDLCLVPDHSLSDWQAAALFGNRKNVRTLSWGMPSEHCMGYSIILGVPGRALDHTMWYSSKQAPNMGVGAVPAGPVDAALLQGWHDNSVRPGCPILLDLGTAKKHGYI